MADPELTEEDRRIARELAHFLAEHDAIPESERIPVTNVDKYSFPIGVDDKGKPFRKRRRARD